MLNFRNCAFIAVFLTAPLAVCQSNIGMTFVPVAPCRTVDTQQASSPALAGQVTRNFTISGTCGVPSTALAYSLNATVIPGNPVGFLTVWPAGQPKPGTSVLNSDGRSKTSSAIILAGTGGAVSVFASNPTHLTLDVNGYFVSGTAGLQYYTVNPCRVIDTRAANGQQGGPKLLASQLRDIPVRNYCGVPSSASAYLLNITAVPAAGVTPSLIAWPTGGTQPTVQSVLDPTGTVVSNSTIVSAGTGGAISLLATSDSNAVIDISGYFAPPGPNGLYFFPVTPCRVLDTRANNGQPFSGTISVDMAGTNCGQPAGAQAYLLNAAVVPTGSLGYLTIWAQNIAQPVVASLTAVDGTVASNLVLTATGNNIVNAFASSPTHLILDMSGYFAAAPPPNQPVNSSASLTINSTGLNNGNDVGGNFQTFKFIYSDPNGAANMYRGDFSFTGTNGSGCSVGWGSNQDMLLFSNGGQYARMGTPGTISDGLCTIDAANSLVRTVDANTISVTIRISFQQFSSGDYYVLTDVGDVNGLTTTPALVGQWTINELGVPPTTTGLTIQGIPDTGSASPGTAQDFRFYYNDINGSGQITGGAISFSNAAHSSSCNIAWTAQGDLTMTSNAARPTTHVGSGAPIGDSMCTVYPVSSSVIRTSVTGFLVTLRLTFTQLFSGTYDVASSAKDGNGFSSPVGAKVGTFTIQEIPVAPDSPTVFTSGSSRGGSAQSLTFRFSDPNGSSNIASGHVYLSGPYGTHCNFNWTRSPATFTATPADIMCALDSVHSTVTTVDNSTIEVTAKVSFTQSFSAAYSVLANVADVDGLSTGDALVGTWTVSPTSDPPSSPGINSAILNGGTSTDHQLGIATEPFLLSYHDYVNGQGAIASGTVAFVDGTGSRHCNLTWTALPAFRLSLSGGGTTTTPGAAINDGFCSAQAVISYPSVDISAVFVTFQISFPLVYSDTYSIQSSVSGQNNMSSPTAGYVVVGSYAVDAPYKLVGPASITLDAGSTISAGSVSITSLQSQANIVFVSATPSSELSGTFGGVSSTSITFAQPGSVDLNVKASSSAAGSYNLIITASTASGIRTSLTIPVSVRAVYCTGIFETAQDLISDGANLQGRIKAYVMGANQSVTWTNKVTNARVTSANVPVASSTGSESGTGDTAETAVSLSTTAFIRQPGQVTYTVSGDFTFTVDSCTIPTVLGTGTVSADRHTYTGTFSSTRTVDNSNAPTISSIVLTPPLYAGGQTIATISGANFGPSQGSGTVNVCAVAADPCTSTPTLSQPQVRYWGCTGASCQISVAISATNAAVGPYDVVIYINGAVIGSGFIPQTGSTVIMPGSARGAITVTAGTVTISAKRLDRDIPLNQNFTDLLGQAVLYGGSEESTSDSLFLKADLNNGDSSGALYTWSVSGAGSENYQPPPAMSPYPTWSVGRLSAVPGKLVFHVDVKTFYGLSISFTREIEVGVRTDDVIVVGWIDFTGVILDQTQPDIRPEVIQTFPSFGINALDLAGSLACFIAVDDLAEGNDNFGGPGLLNVVSRDYILRWLFKFAANANPAVSLADGDFRDDDTGFTSETKVNQFLLNRNKFKLFNRLQIKFRVSGSGFAGTPETLIGPVPWVGTTENPCNIPSFTFNGQAGPANGRAVKSNDHVYQINDGSPDAIPVRAFNTLAGKSVDPRLFWENIGSRITFSYDGGAAPVITVLAYPTYYIFRNGRLVSPIYPQADSPIKNFNSDPYPSGLAPCLKINRFDGSVNTVLGGRCGDQTSPTDPSVFFLPPYAKP